MWLNRNDTQYIPPIGVETHPTKYYIYVKHMLLSWICYLRPFAGILKDYEWLAENYKNCVREYKILSNNNCQVHMMTSVSILKEFTDQPYWEYFFLEGEWIQVTVFPSILEKKMLMANWSLGPFKHFSGNNPSLGRYNVSFNSCSIRDGESGHISIRPQNKLLPWDRTVPTRNSSTKPHVIETIKYFLRNIGTCEIYKCGIR